MAQHITVAEITAKLEAAAQHKSVGVPAGWIDAIKAFKHDSMATVAGQPPLGHNRNYEAAIYSRLDVFGPVKHFDHMSVYHGKNNSFYIFVVVDNVWNVFEDDALFPSDKLISALRCLNL